MAFFKSYQWWVRSTFAVLCIFITVVIMVVFLSANRETAAGVEGEGSHYVRLNQDNNGVIIFVHGVLGDGKSTWTNPITKAYWPNLLENDSIFDHYNIYIYEFRSPLIGKSYTIDELADNMNLILGNAGVFEHKELIFLSHSMGGLVTRALLLKYRELIPKVGFTYFFSTPTTGSELASVAELSKNPQFHDMFPMGENTYIESLQSSWLAAKLKVRSFCAYEILATHGIDVVTRQSATNLCTEPLNPILEDHISIVKPRDQTSLSYIAFKRAFVDTRQSQDGASQ
jgi:pimeloyl-ACP methyl ester carboxylesterase